MKETKKCLTAICMSAMLLTGMTGCSKEDKLPKTVQEESEERPDEAVIRKESGSESDSALAEEKENGKADDKTLQAEENDSSDGGKAQENADGETDKDEASSREQQENYKLSKEEGTEFLPGKIQSVETDSMVIAQTTVVGEGEEASLVTLVDEKDAVKITVKFTADTKVEHWTIQGGGAGIDMQDAAISDLKPGIGVEIEGYYEGETFVAVKIMIEEYK